MTDRIKVIYILGTGHSGSTLLDILLGTHNHIESIGELDMYGMYFHENRERPYEKQICSCGQHVSSCSYWHDVNLQVAQFLGAIPPSLRQSQQADFDRNNNAVIQAVLKITGKNIICDSSKRRVRLDSYLNSDKFDVYILHLIRDGRAVEYSNQKRLGNFSCRRVFRWAYSNVRSWKTYHNLGQYKLVRYEDLVLSPEATLSDILDYVGLEHEARQSLEWSDSVHHNIGGSHVRMTAKRQINVDTTYIDNILRWKWVLSTTVGLPTFIIFGYPLWRKNIKKLLCSV